MIMAREQHREPENICVQIEELMWKWRRQIVGPKRLERNEPCRTGPDAAGTVARINVQIAGFSQSPECFSIAILTSWLRVRTPAFWKSSWITALIEVSDVFSFQAISLFAKAVENAAQHFALPRG